MPASSSASAGSCFLASWGAVPRGRRTERAPRIVGRTEEGRDAEGRLEEEEEEGAVGRRREAAAERVDEGRRWEATLEREEVAEGAVRRAGAVEELDEEGRVLAEGAG